MKKFIQKLLCFLAVFAAVLILLTAFNVLVVRNQNEMGYNASLIDKVDRLRSIKEPKIILVGESNLVFGINSEILEQEMNMPVVNLGLHGGLGNAFNERVPLGSVSEGDIVIVSQVSYSDDDTISDYGLAWNALEYHTDLWYILRMQDYGSFLLSYPSYMFDSFWLFVTHRGNRSPGTQYARDAFNEYGDVVYKPESARLSSEKLFYDGAVNVPSMNDTCIQRLNQLNEYVTGCGAVMLVAACPIPDGEYTPSPEKYRAFAEQLDSALDCDLISDFTDYFIPYRYFFDTVNHLDNDGAVIRTKQLVQDLKAWQNSMVNREE